MSQKVQHIPPSGHLSTASLALLMAGQSLTTQYLSGVDIRGLVLADIAASLLLVLVCGTRFLRIVSLLQGLLSLFCLSYAASMGMPPTLAAILNGSRQIAGMDLRSLWTYIDPAALVALSLLVAIQCWLCGRKPRYRHRWLAIIPACALLATQYNACLLQPPRHFTPEFILGEGRSRFEPPARRSLKYRGYLGTFLMELGSGTAFTPPYVPARTCSSAWTDQIPVPAAPSQLALVQVESLDFELLEMDVDGRPVMPFLRSLLPDAILLRLDGTKKLASANSDFELFNGLEASPDFVHYEYENAYPHSLIAQLGSGGRPVEVFHGLPANYMNLRAAYKLQGFSRYHDIEVMRAAGVRPLDCWWAGVVTDKDLFDYAAQQMPSGPFVQFIITMSMHLPEYVDRIAPERRFCSSSRSAFLTLAHDTDIALRHYVAKLPQGAMLILWGDHRSYSRDNSGLIPFLVYIKGASLHFDGRDLPVMSRCSMYFYLQRIFGKGADAPSCGGSHEREIDSVHARMRRTDLRIVHNSETAKNALTNAAASCFDIPLKPGVFAFASTSPELYIAHAGGVIDGQCHTNSHEAVEESLRRGYRYIELDLQVTRDNHLVAVHDWDRLRDMAGAPELPVPPTLAEVRGLTLKGGLHILDGKDIAELMLRHPRMILITDKIHDMALLARELPFHDRIIVEVFNRWDYLVCLWHGFTPAFSLPWKLDDLKHFLTLDASWYTVSAIAWQEDRAPLLRHIAALRAAGKEVLLFRAGCPKELDMEGQAFLRRNAGRYFTKLYTDAQRDLSPDVR